MSTNTPVTCGHCGRQITAAARGTVGDVWLCHTGTVPPSAAPRDCYRLVTVYQHKTHGACCSEDFAGCSRYSCRDKGVHSLVWGRCEHAVEPPRPDPEFGFWATTMMDDGYPSIYRASIPLAAVLPWTAWLTVDERWQMLEESAATGDPTALLAAWHETAGNRAASAAIGRGVVTKPEMLARVGAGPLRTPDEWCAEYGLDIADPDGWRSKGDPAWDEPIDLPDFWRRFGRSTARIPDQATRDRISADVEAARRVAEDAP